MTLEPTYFPEIKAFIVRALDSWKQKGLTCNFVYIKFFGIQIKKLLPMSACNNHLLLITWVLTLRNIRRLKW